MVGFKNTIVIKPRIPYDDNEYWLMIINGCIYTIEYYSMIFT